MPTNENDTEVVKSEEVVEEIKDDTEVESTESEESPQALKARLQRAEAKIEKMKLDAKVEKKVEKIIDKKTGELDETQLDYLDLKGISEAEDIKIIERHVLRTGETVRQALKDDYVKAKLDANKAGRDVKNATPSSTKRGGNQSNDVGSALAKFDATGELPKDFALKTQVINAITERGNSNKPAWH